MADYTKITNESYKELMASEKPVLIDFWAEWCGPCKIIGPVVEEIATEFKDRAVVGKLNVDENSQIPKEHGIRSIPTLLFFKGGKVVDKLVGVANKDVITDKLKALL